ncbi:TatD family hydrolase [Candidatus Micrarchaeota archaeon]|nr:TatD family hydrolase [Candidatus Micrarchaeota archaeon]
MPFIFSDSHCHLDCMGEYPPSSHPDFLHITCGYSRKSNAKNFEIAKNNPNVFCCLGIAPQEAMKFENVQEEIAHAESEIMAFHSQLPQKIVAIGEIGLDFHWAKNPHEREKQAQCFLSMLSLAKRLSLPVVIHSRDSMDEVISVLERERPQKIMMHCYSGSEQQTKRLLPLGATLSIPPLRSKERKKAIKLAGMHNMVAETDAPYIGKFPQDVQASIQMVADALGIPFEEAQKAAVQNTMGFFGIGGLGISGWENV